MNTILLIFVVSEIALIILFKILSIGLVKEGRKAGDSFSADSTLMAVSKGILERSTLTLGLFLGFPQILILFGALKIGVRIQSMLNCPQYNNFILVGNLITVSVAMLYTVALQEISTVLQWFPLSCTEICS